MGGCVEKQHAEYIGSGVCILFKAHKVGGYSRIHTFGSSVMTRPVVLGLDVHRMYHVQVERPPYYTANSCGTARLNPLTKFRSMYTDPVGMG